MISTDKCDPDFGGAFLFATHSKVLIVREIFVRVYNKQPTIQLENVRGLLDFLSSHTDTTPLSHMEMVETALVNIFRNNPGVEMDFARL